MLRIIGILIGAALAVGFLIVALGVPQFSAPDPIEANVPNTRADSPGTVTLSPAEPEPQTMTESRGSDRSPELLERHEETQVQEQGPGREDTVTVPDPASDAGTLALIDQIFEPGPEPEPFVEENWYAFWSPFRSEIAANGFVSRLQETTGIDYRVVKVRTGVYEVAFSYTDDADIQDKLARISSATGLDMSGS